MGSSSSCCTKVEKFDKSMQTLLIERRNISTLIPSPPPSSTLGENDYSNIWDKNNQLTANFQSLIATKKITKLNRHEKVTRDNKWSSKRSELSYPSEEDSAQLNAKIDGETHECIDFETCENIENLIKKLNEINIQIDDEVQRKIKIITQQEESIINQILQEKQTSEEVLLQQTKCQQEEQDKHYQQLLQDFIQKLEQQKLKYLNQLYQKLKQQRQIIMNTSQTNITQVTQQATITKIQILDQVQKQASLQINKILLDLTLFSNNISNQRIGGEELTKINMSIFSKFGTKSDDQHCQNISSEDLPHFKNTTKKTTYIKPTTNQ